MNQAQPGYQGSSSYPYSDLDRDQDGDRQRLDTLKRKIASIEQRLTSAAEPYPPVHDRPAAAVSARRPGDMQLALTDIAHRQANLNARRTPVAPLRHATGPRLQGPDPETLKGIEAIGRHLGDMKKEIADLKGKIVQESESPRPLEVPKSEIDRIAHAVSEMQASSHLDEAAFERLSSELDELRETMKRDVQSAMRSEFEQSQKDTTPRFTEMEDRLDLLTRNLDSLSQHATGHMSPQVDELSQQLNAVRTSLEDLPQTLAISRLEKRLAEVAEKTESSLAVVAEQFNASDRAGSGIEPEAIASIESRLDEIARALVAVSNQGAKQPKIDMSAVERVEARLADLARTVDEMGQPESNGVGHEEIDQLSVRIQGLTERLGSFEEYARKGDIGAAAAMFASPDTGKIEEQLRQLNNRMADVSAPPQLTQLEEQIDGLHARLEQAFQTHSTSEQISGLEAQIGQVLHQLNDREGAAGAVDAGALEARLAQIEDLLANPQDATLETARLAAQQAVEMIGSQSEQGEIIAALSEDLRSLQDIAETGSRHSEQSAKAVQESLEQVIDRLASIETSMDRGAATASTSGHTLPKAVGLDQIAAQQQEETVAAGGGGVGPIHKAALESGFVDTMPAQVEAPSIDPVDDLDAAVSLTDEEEPENNEPLEPGSSAPDLDHLVQRASAKLKVARKAAQEHGATPLPEDEREPETQPNVVEAARRAVRQAEENNEVVAPVPGETRASSLRASMSKLSAGSSFDFQKFRKPIILAVAVVLLSVIGVRGYQYLAAPTAPVEISDAQQVDPAADEQLAPVAADAKNEERPEPRTVEQGNDTQAPPVERTTTLVPIQEAAPSTADSQAAVTEDVTGQSVAPAADPEAAAPGATDTTAPTETVAQSSAGQSAAAFDVPRSAGPAALVAAARSGDPKALFHLGMRYSEGNGVERNMAEAANWFARSAELGFAPAQYSIGSLNEKGIGIERNVEQAAQWYEKAANQGNARAMHNLAVINAMGNPPAIKTDMAKATEWFRQAAAYGIKDSQFNLGILYGQGMGVPQNLPESYKWFALAAKTGDSDAAKKRDEVADAMDPEDLTAARKEVADWKPRALDEEANRMKAPPEWHGRAGSGDSGSAATQRELIMKAQVMLNQRGFEVGTPDGLMGPKTQKAIAQFQRDAGLPVTGKVDTELLAALDIQV